MDHSPPGSSVHGDSPGKNTKVGCHTLLQVIFPTQGLNPGLPHCRQILYRLSHQGSKPGKRGPGWLGLGKTIHAMDKFVKNLTCTQGQITIIIFLLYQWEPRLLGLLDPSYHH